MRRRAFLQMIPVAMAATARAHAPVAEQGRALAFPRDFGAHPAFRIEWWYATGQVAAGDSRYGFQITFFRARGDVGAENASRFAPRQIVLAHAAVSDVARARLVHAQRAARTGFGDAEAREADTDVRLGTWRLARDARGVYRAQADRAASDDAFAFDLELAPTQPVLLQGDAGFSRKGADVRAASYYYSEPQLAVRGTLARGGAPQSVEGRAWLDHEWAEEMLERDAAGWDWTGINFDDGASLMAFRIRARERDGAPRWAAATLRTRDGAVRTFAPADVEFVATRTWTSPRTGARYPVAFRVRVGGNAFAIEALFDDQELDARGATAIYWEGAIAVRGDDGRRGMGYLELTGYASPLRI